MHLDVGDRIRRRAGLVSLGVALVLLAIKYQAYRMTGSTAILSDALESIVNVVAAGFAVGALVFGGRPADSNHPYGHGKIEFLSAAFEGGLIFFAAFLILYEVVQSLIEGFELRELDRGLFLVLGAGLVNLALGIYLVRTGRAHQSIALVADGRHVISDFWTSAGIAVGLGLVYLTGLEWLDPLVAALVAIQLMWTGLRLVRHAAGALLDDEDVGLLTRLVAALGRQLAQGAIRVHHLRAIRSGRFHHIDVDLVVPEFWPVERAHGLADALSDNLLAEVGIEGELIVHTDPCHRAYCAMCDLVDCPVRREPFRGRPPLTVQEACARPRTSSAA
jgi:cation diffusion facilitator family transporter